MADKVAQPAPAAKAAAETEAAPPVPRRRARPAPAGEPVPTRGAPRGERPPRTEKATRRADKPLPRAARREHFFAPCPKGLEAELLKEIVDLGADEAVPAAGGVAFRGGMALGWKVNLWSRLAVRVLWRLTEGRYRMEDDLYRDALGVDWPDLFDVSRTLAVTTVGRNSPLKSLNFVSLKIKDAVCDRFREATGQRPSVDTREPAVPLVAYLTDERYSIYVDLSGEPLNRRGYRVQAAAAPLNENLAAGLLKLAGWRPGIPLYDPMMGGGTLLLEAGLMALNIAPGLKRHFAFENLKNFDMVEWQRLRKDAQAAMAEPHPLPIFGSDIDPLMVRAAGLNLKAAGLLDCVRIMEADFLNVNPPTPGGLIVSNPPYGVRLSTEDMATFYRDIGNNLKQHFPGWTAYLLSADPELPRQIGLKASRRTPLFNGPLECRFYEYRLVAGGNRR
ncbi:MAG: class I SAM-dependent RNA methyltransferase [Betaproteobacteria bacterium]|nr:class I SAM-dependent RNA methyltransferase [Betaproteobacteria bacterium]